MIAFIQQICNLTGQPQQNQSVYLYTRSISLQLLKKKTHRLMISFFPTQSQVPKHQKPNPVPDNKIKVDFKKFQAFYYNLIDHPIRPQIQDFFLLEDRVDVQEKFNKYDEQQKLMKQTQNTDFFTQNEDLTNPNQKKNLVFRLPSESLNKSQSKIIERVNTSKITYFEINSNLRSGISNKSLFKKSFEAKRQDKQNIEKLRRFLYEQEAVFFLIKGCVQLHKKIEQVPQSSTNRVTQSRQLVESILDYSSTNAEAKNKDIVLSALGSLLSGTESFKFDQSLSFREEEAEIVERKVQKELWKKFQQVKENSFFSLINFKSFHHSQELQYYKFIPKSDCLIAKILINHSLGSSYLKKQQEKLRILSSVLLNSGKADNNTKSQTFKELFDAFQEESFKREMNITVEGRMNERIYVLHSQSQVQFTKRVHFKESQNVQGNKNIKISILRGPFLINAEIFLDSSKTVANLFKSNSFNKKSLLEDTQNIDSEDQQLKGHSRNHSNPNRAQQTQKDPQAFDEAKEVQGLEKKLMIHKKKPSHSKKSSLFKGDRIYFGKDQKSYFEFFLPQFNTSSFTIKSTSAYATVYSISLEKFVELTPERMKKKIAKNYEEFYITCLRKSMQRLQTFEKQVQVSSQKKNTDLKQYSALVSIQKLYRLTPELKNQGNNIDVSPVKVQFQSRKEFRGLKRNDLVYKEGQILQKKMEMIKDKRKDKEANEALTKNFKKKIENLIVQNLKEINLLNTEKMGQQQKAIPINEINKFYAENLTQILKSQRVAPSQRRQILMDQQKTSYSSQKVNQKNESQKQSIIEKQMYVNPDCFDPKKNRSVKISFLRKGHPCVKENQNFLKGVPIHEYTDSIKSHVSVKINETNKINEQFLKIQSKCQSCKCYDDLDSYRNLSSYNSERYRPCSEEHRHSSHDVKYHTMKIGVNWKTKYSSLGKVESKTVYNEKGLQKKLTEMAQDDEPFEKVYNRIKVLKQKSLEKFNFNEHLQRRVLDVKVKRSRKKSAPLLI